MSRTIYLGAIAHSLDLQQIEYVNQAILCVGPDGLIEWVEHAAPEQLEEVAARHSLSLNDVQIVELDSDEFLCPGMIDTHTHAPQYPNLGRGYGIPLLRWLEELTFPSEAKFADVQHAKKIYGRVVQTTLNAGTTTACYYGTFHLEATKALVDICLEKGQRALVGKCSMDRNSPDYYVEPTSSAMSSAQSFVESFPHLAPRTINGDASPSAPSSSISAPLVQPILTPRMAISCTPELLTSLSDLAKQYDPPLAIQTHLDENLLEIEFVSKLFPDSSSYTAVYDDFGLLGPGTILAHCVHLTQEERTLIAQRGAGVSHCPTSNFYIDSGCARVREMLEDGIKVGLGSDCSGGHSHSLLPVLRLASQVSNQISHLSKDTYTPLTVAEVFYLATMGGASLCRIQDRVGNFLPGKEFDALRIKAASPGLWVIPEEKVEERFGRWLWCGDDRDIRDVYVRGRRVGGAASV